MREQPEPKSRARTTRTQFEKYMNMGNQKSIQRDPQAPKNQNN